MTYHDVVDAITIVDLSCFLSKWWSCMRALLRALKVCLAKRWLQLLHLMPLGDVDMCGLNWILAKFQRCANGVILCSLSKYCSSFYGVQALHLRSIDNLFAVLYDYEVEGLTTASQEVNFTFVDYLWKISDSERKRETLREEQGISGGLTTPSWEIV
ncbi:hypothetical protein ANCDUO_10904 [Ancylostoma duodenale]|uniref:Uncharacterized protein n=1 Tax=Ancylostoma duodenale TaxID=51022 RepID=A0A0C2GCS9_9BILA|nr:hypothetical protein ANCDUO_10904 [Ancylostoma duodenale]